MENFNNFDALDIADDWKTPLSRQRIVKEMENIIQWSGSGVEFKSGEIESRVFFKVKTRAEYLTKVAQIKVNLKNISKGLSQNQDLFNKQGQPENNLHNCVPNGIPLTRAQALWITKQPDLINECISDLRSYFATVGFGRLMKDPGNEDWKSPEFRQAMAAKIESEFQKLGLEIARDSITMEKHVFRIAKSCPEYVIMVSKLIVHVREFAQQKQNPDPDVIYLMGVTTYQKNPWLVLISNKKID